MVEMVRKKPQAGGTTKVVKKKFSDASILFSVAKIPFIISARYRKHSGSSCPHSLSKSI